MGLPGGSEGETSPMGGGGASANSEENPSQQERGREAERSWKEDIHYARRAAGKPLDARGPPSWLLRPGPGHRPEDGAAGLAGAPVAAA